MSCAITSAVLPLPLVVFTELDGALLDPRARRWDGAEEALAELERRRIPLILCSDKTRMEMDWLRRKMGHGHPYITENGGGVFIPHGYFSHRIPKGPQDTRHEHCRTLGQPYQEVVERLEDAAEEARVEIVNFRRMTVREIAENNGLAPREAELARLREFSEPFYIAGATARDESRLTNAAQKRGLQITQGARFWNASSGSDIGRALRELIGHYKQEWRGRGRSVALGGSPNDIPMLAAVDVAVVLPGCRGEYNNEVLAKVPRARVAATAGPAGWNQAVMDLLRVG